MHTIQAPFPGESKVVLDRTQRVGLDPSRSITNADSRPNSFAQTLPRSTASTPSLSRNSAVTDDVWNQLLRMLRQSDLAHLWQRQAAILQQALRARPNGLHWNDLPGLCAVLSAVVRHVWAYIEQRLQATSSAGASSDLAVLRRILKSGGDGSDPVFSGHAALWQWWQVCHATDGSQSHPITGAADLSDDMDPDGRSGPVVPKACLTILCTLIGTLGVPLQSPLAFAGLKHQDHLLACWKVVVRCGFLPIPQVHEAILGCVPKFLQPPAQQAAQPPLPPGPRPAFSRRGASARARASAGGEDSSVSSQLRKVQQFTGTLRAREELHGNLRAMRVKTYSTRNNGPASSGSVSVPGSRDSASHGPQSTRALDLLRYEAVFQAGVLDWAAHYLRVRLAPLLKAGPEGDGGLQVLSEEASSSPDLLRSVFQVTRVWSLFAAVPEMRSVLVSFGTQDAHPCRMSEAVAESKTSVGSESGRTSPVSSEAPSEAGSRVQSVRAGSGQRSRKSLSQEGQVWLVCDNQEAQGVPTAPVWQGDSLVVEGEGTEGVVEDPCQQVRGYLLRFVSSGSAKKSPARLPSVSGQRSSMTRLLLQANDEICGDLAQCGKRDSGHADGLLTGVSGGVLSAWLTQLFAAFVISGRHSVVPACVKMWLHVLSGVVRQGMVRVRGCADVSKGSDSKWQANASTKDLSVVSVDQYLSPAVLLCRTTVSLRVLTGLLAYLAQSGYRLDDKKVRNDVLSVILSVALARTSGHNGSSRGSGGAADFSKTAVLSALASTTTSGAVTAAQTALSAPYSASLRRLVALILSRTCICNLIVQRSSPAQVNYCAAASQRLQVSRRLRATMRNSNTQNFGDVEEAAASAPGTGVAEWSFVSGLWMLAACVSAHPLMFGPLCGSGGTGGTLIRNLLSFVDPGLVVGGHSTLDEAGKLTEMEALHLREMALLTLGSVVGYRAVPGGAGTSVAYSPLHAEFHAVFGYSRLLQFVEWTHECAEERRGGLGHTTHSGQSSHVDHVPYERLTRHALRTLVLTLHAGVAVWSQRSGDEERKSDDRLVHFPPARCLRSLYRMLSDPFAHDEAQADALLSINLLTALWHLYEHPVAGSKPSETPGPNPYVLFFGRAGGVQWALDFLASWSRVSRQASRCPALVCAVIDAVWTHCTDPLAAARRRQADDGQFVVMAGAGETEVGALSEGVSTNGWYFLDNGGLLLLLDAMLLVPVYVKRCIIALLADFVRLYTPRSSNSDAGQDSGAEEKASSDEDTLDPKQHEHINPIHVILQWRVPQQAGDDLGVTEHGKGAGAEPYPSNNGFCRQLEESRLAFFRSWESSDQKRTEVSGATDTNMSSLSEEEKLAAFWRGVSEVENAPLGPQRLVDCGFVEVLMALWCLGTPLESHSSVEDTDESARLERARKAVWNAHQELNRGSLRDRQLGSDSWVPVFGVAFENSGDSEAGSWYDRFRPSLAFLCEALYPKAVVCDLPEGQNDGGERSQFLNGPLSGAFLTEVLEWK